MIKMINAVTGVEMWVAEDRVQKYQEAGHKLASEEKPEKPKRTRKK